LKIMDPELNLESPKGKNVHASKLFAAWFKDHVIMGTYQIQIVKCGNNDCTTCKAVRNPSVHHQVKVGLPYPEEDPCNKPHSKDFDEMFGIRNLEILPSTAGKSEEQTIDAIRAGKSLLSGQRVRTTITCSECDKPRCVYSQYELAGLVFGSFDCADERAWLRWCPVSAH